VEDGIAPAGGGSGPFWEILKLKRLLPSAAWPLFIMTLQKQAFDSPYKNKGHHKCGSRLSLGGRWDCPRQWRERTLLGKPQ